MRGVGMYGVLCTLSPKRRAQLTGEPDLIEEIIHARHEEPIPGLLDIGKAWDALSRMLGGPERQSIAADAVLGRIGRPFGPELSYGPARLIEPKDVARVAEALPDDPAALVEKCYPALLGTDVHGGYGRDVIAKGDSAFVKKAMEAGQKGEIEELTATLEKVVDLYRKAAKEGHAMLVAIV